MASPTQRTIAAMKKRGYTCGIVEHWNPHTKTRHDLFGFVDLIAMKPGRIIAVQATSGTNTSARLAKIKAEPRAKVWLEAGGIILIVGWRQLVVRKKDGTKAKRPRWKPKVMMVRSL
jgi:hypothetical protein